MSIYVDQLFATEPSQKWPYKKACHMFSNSLEELHRFARSLGLRREWFQNTHSNPKMHHYDLTIGMRARAVARGAEEIATLEAYRQLWEAKSDGE